MTKSKPRQFKAADVDKMILLRYGSAVKQHQEKAVMRLQHVGQLFQISRESARRLIHERLQELQSSPIPHVRIRKQR